MHAKYREAIKLRFQGESYRKIALETGASKSLVSQWCKHLKLPLHIQKILKEKDTASRQQLAEHSRRRSKLIRAENQQIKQDAFREIHSLSRHELMLIGAALYWTEGYKIEIQKGTPGICFANSDPHMVALFLRFLREILQIPEEKFRVSIHIHPNIKAQSAIKFWAQITNISQEHFRITRQISRASKRKRPQNSLPYGTLDLRVNSRKNCFYIQGWINGLKHQSGLD